MKRGWGLIVLIRFTFSIYHIIYHSGVARDIRRQRLLITANHLFSLLEIFDLYLVDRSRGLSPSSLLLFPRTDKDFSTWELVHPSL